MYDDMQNEPFHQLSDTQIGELLELIRQVKDKEHIAQLYAEICYESALVARHVSKIGFSLSEAWKTANDLEIVINEATTSLLSLRICGDGDEDHQAVAVSSRFPAKGLDETETTVFMLPEQSTDAKNYIMGQLFKAFPADRLVTLFGQFADTTEETNLPTGDEGALKERAIAEASARQNRVPAVR